jgi:hypothetical protein
MRKERQCIDYMQFGQLRQVRKELKQLVDHWRFRKSGKSGRGSSR